MSQIRRGRWIYCDGDLRIVPVAGAKSGVFIAHLSDQDARDLSALCQARLGMERKEPGVAEVEELARRQAGLAKAVQGRDIDHDDLARRVEALEHENTEGGNLGRLLGGVANRVCDLEKIADRSLSNQRTLASQTERLDALERKLTSECLIRMDTNVAHQDQLACQTARIDRVVVMVTLLSAHIGDPDTRSDIDALLTAEEKPC